METTLQSMLEMGLGQTDSKGQTAQDSDDDGITFGGMFLQKVLISIDPMEFINIASSMSVVYKDHFFVKFDILK